MLLPIIWPLPDRDADPFAAAALVETGGAAAPVWLYHHLHALLNKYISSKQCCRSGMFIPDPDLYLSRIPDLGSRIQKQLQKRGVKKIFCHTFLCSHKFRKNVNYFSFEVLKKKIWANFQRIKELFTQKIVSKFSKIWVRDRGSGILDPGSRGQKGIGSRILDPDPQHW